MHACRNNKTINYRCDVVTQNDINTPGCDSLPHYNIMWFLSTRKCLRAFIGYNINCNCWCILQIKQRKQQDFQMTGWSQQVI